MELPVAKQSYLPSADALVRAIKRAEVILARTAAREETLEGATVFANAARSAVGLLNFATELTLPEGTAAGAVVDGIDQWFAQAGAPCAAMDCAGMQWQADLARTLAGRHWRPVTHHVYRVDGYAPPAQTNTDLQIIPARAAYSQLRSLLQIAAATQYGAADEHHSQAVVDTLIDQLDEQRLEYYLARLAGRPVACAGVVSLGQTGVIHAAFTDPAYRGKGIAAALMVHVLEHCRRSLYEHVLLDRVEGCPAIPFYLRLGFKPMADYVRYLAPYHA